MRGTISHSPGAPITTDSSGNPAGRVVGELGSFSELAAVDGATIGINVPNGSANGVRLDSTIGAAAGSVLRVYSPVKCYVGWGATEAAAEANSVIPVDATAGDGVIFDAGTEQLTVPVGLTGQIWLSLWGVSDTGMASIALMTNP